MFNFYSIGFDYPWLVVIAPLPWLIYYFLPPTKAPCIALYAPALATLAKKGGRTNRHIKNHCYVPNSFLFCLLWGLFLFSFAQPYSKYTETTTPLSSDTLMIALDISDSMMTEDATLLQNNKSSRLDAAQYFLKQVINHYSQNKTGLIMFGSTAYLVAPLTYDHTTLIQFIKNIKTGMAGARTAIGDTISFSMEKLLSASNSNTSDNSRKIVLLLTDGENTAGTVSPMEAAKLAAKHGILVFTLGIGIAHQHEEAIRARLALHKIAETTGAIFVDAEQSDALQKIISAIDKTKTLPAKTTTVAITKKHSLIFWPSLFIFLISIYWLFSYTRGWIR